jgi:RNA-directed DNA polymerase
MKEPYREGRADHSGPESCVDRSRKAASEALTGVRAGQPLSCEIRQTRVPTLLSEAEGHIEQGGPGESFSNPAQSKTLCTRGNFLRGNREIPWTPKGRWSPRAGRRRPKAEHPI